MNLTCHVGIGTHNSQQTTRFIAPQRLTGICQKPRYKWACVGPKDISASPTYYFLPPLQRLQSALYLHHHSLRRRCEWRARLEYFFSSCTSNNLKGPFPSTLPPGLHAPLPVRISVLPVTDRSPHHRLVSPPGDVALPSPVDWQIEFKVIARVLLQPIWSHDGRRVAGQGQGQANNEGFGHALRPDDEHERIPNPSLLSLVAVQGSGLCG
jgi:hypothetical protein